MNTFFLLAAIKASNKYVSMDNVHKLKIDIQTIEAREQAIQNKIYQAEIVMYSPKYESWPKQQAKILANIKKWHSQLELLQQEKIRYFGAIEDLKNKLLANLKEIQDKIWITEMDIQGELLTKQSYSYRDEFDDFELKRARKQLNKLRREEQMCLNNLRELGDWDHVGDSNHQHSVEIHNQNEDWRQYLQNDSPFVFIA